MSATSSSLKRRDFLAGSAAVGAASLFPAAARAATEDGAIVRVVLVGTTTGHAFTHGELFEHLDSIENYRNGDPVPSFG